MKNNWKKYRIFTAFLWSLLFLAGWNLSGVKAAAAAGPSCAKTKTVYFQKQTFPDPVSQKVINSYDLLGTGELDLKHLSGKAVIRNLKSSNRHIQAVADVLYKKIYLSADSLKNGEKTVLSFTVKQNGKSCRLTCKVTFRTDFIKKAKLGNLDLTRKLNRSVGALRVKTAQKKAKVTIALPTGYKIVSIRYNYKGQEAGPVWKKAKKLKNGGILSVKKNTVLLIEYAPKTGKTLYNRSYIIRINGT